MPSPLPTSGYSKEPTAVGHSHDEKDLTFEAEMVDARSDSDINPGELTFEEGQSLVHLCFRKISLTFDARHCRWDGSPSGCLQLHNAQVTTPPHLICQIYLRCELRPASALSSALVYSPLHHPSSSLSGLSAHPWCSGSLDSPSRFAGSSSGSNLAPCFHGLAERRCTLKPSTAGRSTSRPLFLP